MKMKYFIKLKFSLVKRNIKIHDVIETKIKYVFSLYTILRIVLTF